MERVLGGVDGRSSAAASRTPASSPTATRRQQAGRADEVGMRRDREHGPGAEQVRPDQRRGDALARATGMRLRGFHSNSSSSTASSTAAIGVPNVADIPPAAPATSSVLRSAAVRWKSLGDQRAERAAGHDDRPLGAERPARADRDGRRERLEQRDLRLHPALADQDRLHRLGDAVPPDPLRAVAGHQADDQPARRPARAPPASPACWRRRRCGADGRLPGNRRDS